MLGIKVRERIVTKALSAPHQSLIAITLPFLELLRIVLVLQVRSRTHPAMMHGIILLHHILLVR